MSSAFHKIQCRYLHHHLTLPSSYQCHQNVSFRWWRALFRSVRHIQKKMSVDFDRRCRSLSLCVCLSLHVWLHVETSELYDMKLEALLTVIGVNVMERYVKLANRWHQFLSSVGYADVFCVLGSEGAQDFRICSLCCFHCCSKCLHVQWCTYSELNY